MSYSDLFITTSASAYAIRYATQRCPEKWMPTPPWRVRTIQFRVIKAQHHIAVVPCAVRHVEGNHGSAVANYAQADGARAIGRKIHWCKDVGF